MKKLPIIAIVGRANVGKSSLFNQILKHREAIVAREAGTTRDSIMSKATYKNHDFWLVDTAGVKDAEDEFEFTIQDQIIQAVDSADIIWVMVESDIPITQDDRKISKLALKSKKPTMLIVNKMDKTGNKIPEGYDRLGIKPIFGTSTTQGAGIIDLLDELTAVIPKIKIEEETDSLCIAIVGRPNTGKSQLFNTLAKKQQAIVADRAGTTRDVNRLSVKYEGKNIVLMDTAGIRRSGKIEVGIERFSVIRTLSAIEQSDVCLLLMEATELNVQLDQKIAGMVKDAGKGLILVVSKWDLVEDKTPFTRDELAAKIADTYNFVPWASLIFTSSVTGQNVTQIFKLAAEIAERRQTKIATSELNRWLHEVINRHPPAGLKNRAPKLNYMVQETENEMPSFKIFGSQTKFLHWSYKRYLEREFRERYKLEGSALKFWFIEKHEPHKHGTAPTREKRQ